MLNFLFDLFGEFFIMIVMVAVFAGWEYISFRTSRRVWMWVAGLAGIAVLIWFKGAGHMWSWALGAGWLGVLAYGDHKLHVEAKTAAEAVGAADVDVGSQKTRKFGAPRN